MTAPEEQPSAETAAGLPLIVTPARAAEILRGAGLEEITECALRTRAYRKQIPCHINGRRIIFTLDDLREIAQGQARRPEEHTEAAAPATAGLPKPRRHRPAARPASTADATPWRARQVRRG
jgi:hypothetical protein